MIATRDLRGGIINTLIHRSSKWVRKLFEKEQGYSIRVYPESPSHGVAKGATQGRVVSG